MTALDRFLCFFGFHKWAKWETIQRGRYTYWGGGTSTLVEKQRRECAHCGASRMREVS